MAHVMALLSAQDFEQAALAQGGVGPGDQLALGLYACEDAELAPAHHDALYLVTVRRIDDAERLWLVANEYRPQKIARGWWVGNSTDPIVDVTALAAELGLGDGDFGAALARPRALDDAALARLRRATDLAKQPWLATPEELGVATPAPPDEAALLAAVWADPAADAPRAVYGDWLEERGDPRGELMRLELARATRGLTPAETQRDKELLSLHVERWLGPLAGVVAATRLTFARGFVDEGVVVGEPVDHPAWSTLTTLVRGAPPPSTPMPLVRLLDELDDVAIERLASRAAPLPVEELRWHGPAGFRYGARDFDVGGLASIAAFARIACLPRLRRLVLVGENAWQTSRDGEGGIPHEALRWAWSAPPCAKLEELALPAPMRHLPALQAALAPTTIQRFVLGQNAAALTLTRDDTGALTRLAVEHPDYGPDNLSAHLDEFDQLPADLFTAIEVTVAALLWQRFNEKKRYQAALKRHPRAGKVAIHKR